jgi:hypothetical protein
MKSGQGSHFAPMERNDLNERIVLQLLLPSGVPYLKEVGKILEKDPDYLRFHSASISLKVNEILSRTGSQDHVTEGSVAAILWEAVIRLRSFER